MVINGYYEQTSEGYLGIELNGYLPGTSYDVLEVSGAAMLDGTLNVALFDSGSGPFIPKKNDTFTILTATGGVVNQFADEPLTTYVDGQILEWEVQYNIADVTLRVLDVLLAGDMNGDDVVNLGDASALITALINLASYDAMHPTVDADLVGDIDGSGMFDLGDVAMFSTMFTPPATATVVPEPSTLTVIACALLGLIGYGQRKRRT